MQGKVTQMVRVREVANLLDVHISTVYRLVEAGDLRAVRVGAGKGAVRIPMQSLDAYLARLGLAASSVEEVA